jgi:hypothetical protein
MDNDDETKDYLEQLGYTVTTISPSCLIIPSIPNEPDQQPANKLSEKLIKSKYKGNLKDVRIWFQKKQLRLISWIQIITGCVDIPVIIADNNIEESFDLQGYFIGKIPFDLDKNSKTKFN